MSAHTGRADDRPKSILEETPEGDLAFTDGVVEHIRLVGVLATELDQLPHQLIGFSYGQLIPSRNCGMDAIVTVVMDFGSETLGIVVGDADAQISLFHVLYFLSVPLSWNNYSIAEVG